jgi:hypothetical protein
MTSSTLVNRPSVRVPRARRVAATALLAAAASMPLTGVGTALGADHAPAQVKVAALADPVPVGLAVAKHDV